MAMVSNGLAGRRESNVDHGTGEYAGELGTAYRDWHTTPWKASLPLYRTSP